MTVEQRKYNMKAVSKILGIQPGTLRAWERRYHIIQPERNEAGHRLYTEKHLSILKWLLKKVEEGFTIGQAASLLEENQKEELVSKNDTNENQFLFHDITYNLLHALLSFDDQKSVEIFGYALSLFSIEKVYTELPFALLSEVQQLKNENKLSTVHEQYINSFIRFRLGAVFQAFPQNNHLSKSVTVCVSGENNEVELLIYSIYLKICGFRVVYLGTSVQIDDLIASIAELNPKLILLSFSTGFNDNQITSIIERITEKNNDSLVAISGQTVEKLDGKVREKIKPFIIGQTVRDWERWLKANKLLL